MMRADLDSISDSSDGIRIQSRWFVPAPRGSVYAVVSDFERLPRHFPKIARATKVVSRDGNRLVIDAEAASFGRFFPVVRLTINVELLPGEGYRCSTFNRTFHTTGEEELLLSDASGGTEIAYSYAVKLRHRWLRPVYSWLVRRFGLRFWKRAYLEPPWHIAELTTRAPDHALQRTASAPSVRASREFAGATEHASSEWAAHAIDLRARASRRAASRRMAQTLLATSHPSRGTRA